MVIGCMYFMLLFVFFFLFFFLVFFNDTATTEIYTLSLHDALPISHVYQKTVSQVTAYFGVGGYMDTDEHSYKALTG